MLAFWFAVKSVLYVGMTYYTRLKPAKVTANGEWVIPRTRDGHFYVAGSVNGIHIDFLVDTGASLVTVTDDFAQKAFLVGGINTTQPFRPQMALALDTLFLMFPCQLVRT